MNQSKFVWLEAPISRRRFLEGSAAVGVAAGLMPRYGFAASGGKLRIRDYADIQQLDPAYFTGVNDELVMGCIHNKLINYKPGNKWDWQLEAAESVEQIDERRIAFDLRRGIQFTNDFGEMTAEDVKFSFERIIDPAVESPIKPDWGPLSHVEVTGSHSGNIVFEDPFQPAWMIALPYGAGNIISRKAFEAGKRYGANIPCTSGPYVLKVWEPKQRTVLVRSDLWNGPPPAYDEIRVLPIDDERSGELAFEAGDIDFTRISLGSLESYLEKPPRNGKVSQHPSLYYRWLGMNLEHPKLKDKRVRQAIQWAVNVPAIMDAAYFGLAKPSTGLVAPGLIGHRPESLVPPEGDIEKAKALLAEAGYPNGGLELRLDVLSKSTNVTTAQVVQANLAEIGIDLEISPNDSGAFWTLGMEDEGDRWKDMQLILNRFSMTPDPYYATSWFICDQVGIWNWERFCNKEFDELHQKALGEPDIEKRDAMYRRMQDIMEETGAYRFITHEANPVMYRTDVKPALRPDGIPLLRYFEKA